MPLINHDGDLLDCGHYVSDFLMPTQEFGGNVMMTISLELVILPKGVYISDVTKKRKVMSGSTDVLFVVYIITSNMTQYRYIFTRIHQYVQNQSYKKVIEDLNVFRK